MIHQGKAAGLTSNECCIEVKPADAAEYMLNKLYVLGATIQGHKLEFFHSSMDEIAQLTALHEDLKNYLSNKIKREKK